MRLFRSAFFLLPFLFASAALAQSADVFVTKDAPPQVTAGSDFDYTVTVGNVGPDGATNVAMNDVLPSGLTFNSLSQSGPDTFVCSTPGFGSGGTVTCNASTMAAGDQQIFTISVHVPASTPNGVTFFNTATVTSDADPNVENNASSTGTSTPPDTADVAIVKSGPSAAAPNTDVTYTITLTNFGPADAASVSWTDTLPSGVPPSPMTFVSFNQTSGPSFNCPSPGTTVTCTLATFTARSTATFQFVGHIPNGTGSGTTYSNVASQKTNNDPNPENDSSGTALTVSSADVGVTKSAPPTGIAGNTIAYVITLSNGGPDAATNALFNDTLSGFETFVSAVQNTGPAGSCSPPPTGPGGTFTPGGTVTCGVNILGNGQSAQFTITVLISPSTPNGTVITNTANASSGSSDSNPNNNSSSANTTVSASADVAVTKNGSGSVTAGSNATYTINVANSGPSDAGNVTLTDVLPPGTTFVSFVQNSGPVFNCTTGATVSCSIASLTAGSTAAFTLTVHVSSGATGTLANTANVTSTTPDPNNGNNSSTSTATVSTSADLSVVKSGPFTPVATGFNIVYNISVANSGPSDAATVTLTDALPPGTTFVSMNQTSGPAFNCTGTTTVTCTIGTLVNGASATFQLTVHDTATAGTTLSNTAIIGSTTSDPNPANNSSTAQVTVVATIPLLSPSMLMLLALALAAGAWVAMRKT